MYRRLASKLLPIEFSFRYVLHALKENPYLPNCFVRINKLKVVGIEGGDDWNEAVARDPRFQGEAKGLTWRYSTSKLLTETRITEQNFDN